MSEFFSHYPKTAYNITGEKEPTKLKVAIDIMNRTKIKDVLMNDIVQFLPYSIPENERPDVTADKFYGSPKFTWLLFAVNEIHDPIWDWPLGTREFNSYIQNKYGSISAASQGIHHYEITQQSGDTKVKINIGADNTDHSGATAVSNYEYEEELQNQKRRIKIINSVYIPSIMAEFETRLKEGDV